MFNLLKNLSKNPNKTNMEKEILEQPDTIANLIKKYISNDGSINIDLPNNIKRVELIASGSSYHSAAIAANYLRESVHCPAQAFYAGEFSLLENVDVDSETLYIFISQSGETSDTNKCLDKIRVKTDNVLSITNTKNSTLYNNAKYKVLLYAGEEKSIASTKALCAQIYCLFLIAAKIMIQREISSSKIIEQLNAIPTVLQNVFNHHEKIKEFAKKLGTYDSAVVLGSGLFSSLAQEGALKIKETSYINTNAYPTGEFLHGHIATLNKKCAVISIVNNTNVDFSLHVLGKINGEYSNDCLVISAFPIELDKSNVAVSLNIYNDVEFLFATLLLLQLLAFENATLLGRNVDAPTGLTKIVK